MPTSASRSPLLWHIFIILGGLSALTFIGVAPPDRADKDFHKLGWLLQDIGIWESEHKACPPSLLMVVLSIMFNTIDMTISISPE